MLAINLLLVVITATAGRHDRAARVRRRDELDDFRSAQDLHALLRQRGDGIGLATVYRM